VDQFEVDLARRDLIPTGFSNSPEQPKKHGDEKYHQARYGLILPMNLAPSRHEHLLQ